MRPWYREVLQESDPALRAEVVRALAEERRTRKRYHFENAGRVVEFRRGKGHVCGVLRPQKGGRGLHVLDQEGREINVRGSKIIDISTERVEARQRDEIVRILRDIDRRRETAKARVDLRTLWKVAREAGKKAWTLDELTELYFGEKAPPDSRAVLSRALEDGHWFTRDGREFAARPESVVEQRDKSAAQQQEDERRMQAWAGWLRRAADGKETGRPEGAGEAIALLEQVALRGEQAEEAAAAARLMKSAHLHGPLAAFEVLVQLGHWDPDENLELRRHQIPVEFAAEVTAKAEASGWRPEALKSRRWWGRHVYGFSHRGEGCDRAFSIRRTLFGYRVGVHLASPALLAEGDGTVDGAARERGVSLHLPERLIPMLPAAFGEKVRLTADELRPTLTLELRFSRSFELKGCKIRVRRVRPGQVLSWEEGDARLTTDKYWQRLRALALELRRKRQEGGALILPESEVELRLREGKVELRLVDGDAPARLVCEELAILANAAAGAFCVRHDISAVYRAAPPVKRVERGTVDERVWVHEQMQLMAKAGLQVAPGRHYELGVDEYAPISRPLHRYTDLLMHRQLVHFATGGKPRYVEEEMERVLVETAWARQAAGRIAGKTRRYWLLKYLEGLAGQEVEAVVLERRGNGYLVELGDCRWKGFVPGGRELWAVPGDRMRVKIARASARRDLLRLEEGERE